MLFIWAADKRCFVAIMKRKVVAAEAEEVAEVATYHLEEYLMAVEAVGSNVIRKKSLQ